MCVIRSDMYDDATMMRLETLARDETNRLSVGENASRERRLRALVATETPQWNTAVSVDTGGATVA